MTKSKPTRMPGQETEGSESAALLGNAAPQEPSAEEMAVLFNAETLAAPTLQPPAAQESEEAITVWLNDKRIDALWGIGQHRNSWMRVAGVGWKKLANSSDSAIVAFTTLSAHARQMNSPVNYREEADGMIHEMYVW